MRRVGIMLAAFVVALIGVNLATGQAQRGAGAGGFGRGGFGGGGALDPVSLVRMQQVRKELEITDEQMDKLPAALSKALKEVLDEKQQKRLRQIELQLQGTRAYTEADVQGALKLSGEQKENIATILEESAKDRTELLKEAKGGGGQGMREKLEALTKETKDKVNGVLTADQRKTFRSLTGPEFKLEFGGFGGGAGGFGGFGKKNFKKKDTQ